MPLECMEKPTLVFVCGPPRSGSTLLTQLLSQRDYACSVGEMLGYLWDRGFHKNQLCGCGEPFRSCSFWEAVFQHTYQGALLRDLVSRATALEGSVARIRHTPLLAFPQLMSHEYEELFREYIDIWETIFHALVKVSGKTVIIESSKRPLYGWLAAHIPSIHLKVVHLVRDSRAVAYSWQRKKRRPEIQDRQAYMAQHDPLGVAVRWNMRNLTAHLFDLKGISYKRILYEELASKPASALNELHAFISKGSFTISDRYPEDKVKFAVPKNHTVSGNPIRLDGGHIRVRPDMKWLRKMTPSDKLKVSLLTSPLLVAYGYDPFGRETSTDLS